MININTLKKMQYNIDKPVQAKEIGINGKVLAYKIFDYQNVASQINNFLEQQY